MVTLEQSDPKAIRWGDIVGKGLCTPYCVVMNATFCQEVKYKLKIQLSLIVYF